MNNIQINGQRRWGPPENWLGPPPPHGTEIFIKNLPKEVFELELYDIFSEVGVVYEVRLPVHWNGLNRGYAFLRYTSISAADRAIDVFDNYEIRNNRKIKVARSVDNTRLFLSAVPVDKNAEDLKKRLLNYVENVKKVYVYPTLENRSMFRGYAFVEFETHRDAAIAKRVLTPDVCQGIFEKKCVAAWANPLPFLDQSVLKSLNVLFMRNIPNDISGFHLKQVIENFTKQDIQRIKKLNDFAFLTFKDHKSAKTALNYMKDAPIVVLNHETQAEWAVPREMFVSYPEKKCQESGNHSMRSEISNYSYPCELNGAITDNGFNTESCSGFQNNLLTLKEHKNEIFNSNTTGNCFPAEEEVFSTSSMNNLKPQMRNENRANSYYYQKQNCDSDASCLDVLLSPVLLENNQICHSFRSDTSHSGNVSLPKHSVGLYSRPPPTTNTLQMSQGKSSEQIELCQKVKGKGNVYFLDIKKNLKVRYPLQQIYNSESDSDEGMANPNRLRVSSSAASAITNWSSGTASQTFSSDEQDFSPRSPIGKYFF